MSTGSSALVSLACPFAALTGIIPEKGHSQKAHCLWLLSYPSTLFFFHSCFAAIVDDEHSVVHGRVAHPSCTQAAARYTAAMAC